MQHVRDAVASKERTIALLIGGSYEHAGFDEHFDLDFVVVVRNEIHADVMASRLTFVEYLPIVTVHSPVSMLTNRAC